MQILVPDDPVFISKFIAIEQPLLYSLYYFYLSDLDSTQAKLISTAYDSWDQIQQRLPIPLQWQITAAGGCQQHLAAGYVLHDLNSRELPSLYTMDLPLDQLHTLQACHSMLAQVEKTTDGPLAEALTELADQGPDLVDDFRRALEVMNLKAPQRLLEALQRASAAGPVMTLILDEALRADYHDFCSRVVYVLSGGDRFTYTSHLALYP
ncbi:hypothetical protein ACFYQA_27075 [Streptomyces sp. NPDC005774]|uniref:hypothetical protein n=1 Tax=Streptomyces sp. NPDC005774 TaxID=3364728 RepID=UPI00369B14EC